jgi:hypothetical protein
MVVAISLVGHDASVEYAKIALRHTLRELNLSAWESHPNRTRADVHALFRKTIGRLTPRRGGWHVHKRLEGVAS